MNTNQKTINMKFDIKNLAILILVFLLVLSFLLGKKEGEVNNVLEIKSLHKTNDSLTNKNKFLYKSIDSLTIKIDSTKNLISDNDKKVKSLQTQIEKLQDEKNKIYPSVKHMSANVVANTFSNYLQKRR